MNTYTTTRRHPIASIGTMLLLSCLLLLIGNTDAFAPSHVAVTTRNLQQHYKSTMTVHMMMDSARMVQDALPSLLLQPTSPSMLLLAETEAWVQPTALILGPFLNFMSFAMLCRVVASWYPETNLKEFPWAIVAWPSEPLLRLVKGTIPPAFGVDITPVFWLAIFTFLNEILLGQQGLLVMKLKYGI